MSLTRGGDLLGIAELAGTAAHETWSRGLSLLHLNTLVESPVVAAMAGAANTENAVLWNTTGIPEREDWRCAEALGVMGVRWDSVKAGW